MLAVTGQTGGTGDALPLRGPSRRGRAPDSAGRLFDPLTRRLLRQAGLAPGMRVLDLGSGAGNVARLARELVGPDGSVVGVERDPAAAALARQRTDEANIEFR